MLRGVLQALNPLSNCDCPKNVPMGKQNVVKKRSFAHENCQKRRMAIANWTCISWVAYVRPWDNRGKCYIDRKRIQCLSNASQHVPIYLQPFLRHSKLLVENCDIFTPHLCLAAPRGMTPLEFRKDLDIHKTRMNGLSCGEGIVTISSAVLIQYQRVTDGWTDRRTDRRPVYIYYVLHHSWRT